MFLSSSTKSAYFASHGQLLICLVVLLASSMSASAPVAAQAQVVDDESASSYSDAEPCHCARCETRRRETYACRPACPSWWLDAEYLHWWPDATRNTPLLTSSSAGTSAANSGVIGLTSTRTLLGSDALTSDGMNGGRITFGYWTVPKRDGVELSYFNGQVSDGQSFSSPGNSILARPYFDSATNSNAALLIAHPSFLTGSATVDQEFTLQGAEAMIRSLACESNRYRWDWLVGYRYLSLDEELRIASTSRYTVGQGGILAGTTKTISDTFETENAFHGVQGGIAYRELFHCFAVDMQLKLAVGGTTARSIIDGRTTNTVPGAGASQFAGGLLAQSTNIGRVTHREASIVPELRIGASTRITHCLRLSAGYNLLAWSNILRTADQIDSVVSQLPPESARGLLRPATRNDMSTLLMQGVSVGLQLDY